MMIQQRTQEATITQISVEEVVITDQGLLVHVNTLDVGS